MAACSDSYLSQEPAGGTIRQDQFEKLNNTLEGSMRGIYAMMYAYGGQDSFGERAIDMYSDILSGDMAVTARLYGWFYCDENMETNTDRTDYLWGYYYSMLHNLNSIIDLVGKQKVDMRGLDADGLLPNVYDAAKARYYKISGGDTLAVFTENDAHVAGYYAEALTMRGYALMRLLHWYCPTAEQSSRDEALTVPVYTYETQDGNVGPATLAEMYAQIEGNLKTAIAYFDAFKQIHTRTSKLVADATVARAILAYAYLNKANSKAAGDAKLYTTPYSEALKYAEEVVAAGGYRILPRANLYSTGFNNINEQSWIWGQEVTSETATLLGSFFGQVDIHTYSYAWAGETKACDANLYASIPAWDARKGWFNDGSANKTYKLCPDKKFYNAKCPTSTRSEDIDRDYTSDNVFLRVEAVYLMAAEAAYRLGDYAKSISYLTAITDQRVTDDGSAAYAAWKGQLSNVDFLKEAIGYNWRIEMWGEGFGAQTLRRLTSEIVRGDNHLCMKGATIHGTDPELRLVKPSNEYIYNPSIAGDGVDKTTL